MYLSATDQKLTAVMSAAVTTTSPDYSVAWQDITVDGMTLPQSSSTGNLNGATPVDIVASPAASTNRQVAHINICNTDSITILLTISKNVGGTDFVLIEAELPPGATLEWSRESGWNIINNTGVNAFAIQSFIASGTYVKPANLKWAMVSCVGAGGGGGSGRQGIAGENRFGGSGGSGGAVVFRLLNTNDISASTVVTVGTGGTGATGQASTSTNGKAGTAGGDTSFGGTVVARGGLAGNGGTTSAAAAVAGGSGLTGTPNYGPFAISGAISTASTTSTTSTAGTGGMTTTSACPGGAGGGGISNLNVSATSAGQGGGVYNNGSLVAGPVVASPNGTSNAAPLLFMSTSLSSIYGIGTAGAGSYPGSPGNGSGAGSGGNAGDHGAGGGGGTGTLNGTTSGAGGSGGGGLCQVLELF